MKSTRSPPARRRSAGGRPADLALGPLAAVSSRQVPG